MRKNKHWQLALACSLWFAGLAGAGETDIAQTKPKKIVLIAGKKSHGPVGNGMHDYPWSVRLLKVMLEHSNVKDSVRVEVHLNDWPEDAAFEGADTIMLISDGRDGALYLDAPMESEAHVASIQKQVKLGCGFVTFHFSTFAPAKLAPQMLAWTGGYFQWEQDGVKKWYSAIKTLKADLTIDTPAHPVARGVKPFNMTDEFYYNIRFAPDDKALRPLLSAAALPGREPDGRIVAWAREREDGGRGFGTTAGHYYDNWKNDDFRKLILNAIVWSAHVEVPLNGVETRFYSRDEITTALEGKN